VTSFIAPVRAFIGHMCAQGAMNDSSSEHVRMDMSCTPHASPYVPLA